MLSILQQAYRGLEQFIDTCPKTSIHILYFSRSPSGGLSPRYTTEMREWNPLVNKKYLISKGSTNGWCYIYDKKTIEYLVRIQGDHIKEFIWGDTESTKTNFVSHGDHITVGITLYQNQLILKTHLTTYDEITAPNIHYNRNEYTCNMNLSNYPNGITKTTPCEPPRMIGNTNRTPPSALQSVYNHYNQSEDMFRLIRYFSKIYLGHKGIYHKLHSGNRGGLYILKNNKKKYVKSSYKGHGFSDEFIQFITQYVLEPAMRLLPGLEKITLIYDKNSELGENTHRQMVLLYDFRDDYQHRYYIDVEKALIAHYAATYPTEATSEEISVFESFKQASKAIIVF